MHRWGWRHMFHTHIDEYCSYAAISLCSWSNPSALQRKKRISLKRLTIYYPQFCFWSRCKYINVVRLCFQRLSKTSVSCRSSSEWRLIAKRCNELQIVLAKSDSGKWENNHWFILLKGSLPTNNSTLIHYVVGLYVSTEKSGVSWQKRVWQRKRLLKLEGKIHC